MDNPLLSFCLVGWSVLAATLAAVWARQRRTGNATPVDLVWTLGVGGLGVAAAVVGDGDPLRRTLLAVIVGTWAGRLALHMIRRVGEGVEDGRYRALREELGDRAQTWFFVFFQAQGALAVVLAVPFLIVAGNTAAAPTVTDLAAVGLWIVSLVGESVADRQLEAFRDDPANRGKTCRRRLWRYSRHPNYFFEWLHWLAYPLLAVGAPYAAVALLSPAIMLFLILKVTGIPPTEAQALRSRGDDYRAYQRSTSPFVPWFPREEARP